MGVDIWLRTFGKVLNIEWDDRGRVSVQSFQRGTWEVELLSVVKRAAMSATPSLGGLAGMGN